MKKNNVQGEDKVLKQTIPVEELIGAKRGKKTMEKKCVWQEKDEDLMRGEERRLKIVKNVDESNRGREKKGTFYLDSHLSNKYGSKDVVGNCEKQPFL